MRDRFSQLHWKKQFRPPVFVKPSRHHNLIRDERRRVGLTQEHLACLVGCDRSQIAQIERGKRSPSLAVALKLELVFARPVYKLFEQLRQMTWREVISQGRRLNEKLLLAGCLQPRVSYKTSQLAE